MINMLEAMPFKKFVQYHLNKRTWTEDIVLINGTFKELPCGKIVEGDIFEANLLGGFGANVSKKQRIEETYKAYLKWFNYTRHPNEREREFVSVKKISEVKNGKNNL